MHCTLLIPHLFWPRDTADLAGQGLKLPALSALLARADAERFPALTFETWLCQAFEIERQNDWPIAPLTYALDGGEPGTAYWLRADPVHIKVSREGLHLVDSELFDISAGEADSLRDALNAQFAEAGMTFFTPHPKRWYLRCAEAPAIVTHPLSEVAGRDVHSHLPKGEDALDWHRRFNEVQMLLHSHSANEAREDRGEPPVNSVWFWGGGTMPLVRGRHFGSVATNDTAAAAVSAAADVAVRSLHADADGFMASASTIPSELPHLAILDRLASPVAYRDAGAWRDRVEALEGEWFAPLYSALRKGRIASLHIVALGDAHCCRFMIGRSDLLKLWRRPKALAAYS